ncbi:hypothetical protein P7L70_02350 (plasmid) [Tistrella mobilis]
MTQTLTECLCVVINLSKSDIGTIPPIHPSGDPCLSSPAKDRHMPSRELQETDMQGADVHGRQKGKGPDELSRKKYVVDRGLRTPGNEICQITAEPKLSSMPIPIQGAYTDVIPGKNHFPGSMVDDCKGKIASKQRKRCLFPA